MNIIGIFSLIGSLPLEDIEAAIKDPTNLGKEAKVVEDILTIALPGVEGSLIAALVALFVTWVQASGGGTIAPDPNPIADGQTTPTPHTGRNG